ncbi:MAG: hydrolase [Bacteroidetes bacterium]|nr:hydrolase [Bacteroidota bacterium]
MEHQITLTADVIIRWADGSIVLAKRKSEPYKGYWGLPGGKLEGYETIQDTAIREAKEETGLDIRLDKVIGVYSDPGRDPRGRYISVVFLAHPVSGILESGSDAEEVMLTKDFAGRLLAFDHHHILTDYLASSINAHFEHGM